MQIETPNFVLVDHATRFRARSTKLYGPWKSERVPYHQGEMGILHPKLKENYLRGGGQGMRFFQFDSETDGLLCVPEVSERDEVVVLYDENFKRQGKGCEGFYAVLLNGREYDAVVLASGRGPQGGDYDEPIRQLMTFDLRFGNRLYDIPIEFARREHVPKEKLKELERRHQPMTGGVRRMPHELDERKR